MKVVEAHQIANPEILKIFKKRDILEKIRLSRRKIGSKGQVLDNYNLEQTEEFVLQGILIAQEKEYKFLEDLCWILQDVLAKETAKLINKRLEALKISNEDLRKVLK